MRNSTIKDIAKKAGVSIATVSRVINNNYAVSDEVEKLVKSAAKELNYKPNANARSLRSKDTGLIALVITDLSDSFFMDAAKGMDSIISESDYNLTISSSMGDAKKEQKLIDSLLERRIAGLVIACVDKNPARLHACEAMGIPIVVIDRKVEAVSASQVIWDNRSGSFQLTDHLIDCGHRQIAIVNVSFQNDNGQERLEGFQQAMKAAGINCPKEYISKPNFYQKEAYDFVLKVMRLPNPPSAVFCANNIMLEGTLEALRDLNLRVYDDVSVVMFGNPECNKYLERKITAAVQEPRSMGEVAGRVMCDLLKNRNISKTQTVLKTKIFFGESVKKI